MSSMGNKVILNRRQNVLSWSGARDHRGPGRSETETMAGDRILSAGACPFQIPITIGSIHRRILSFEMIPSAENDAQRWSASDDLRRPYAEQHRFSASSRFSENFPGTRLRGSLDSTCRNSLTDDAHHPDFFPPRVRPG